MHSTTNPLHATAIPLTASSPYGALAQLVFLATDGSAVAAVGTATGGAHLNPRWTVWRGSVADVREQPQPMETFGGWNAGSLDGLAMDPQGPLLIGSWSTGPGSIATALWTTSGARWLRDPTAAALAGGDAEVGLATGIATRGPASIVVAGFVTAPGSATLRAAVWLGDRSGRWHRLALPGADTDSVATAVACGPDDCWVAGRVASRAVLWQVHDETATAVTDLPELTVAASGQTPLLAMSDGVVWLDIAGSDQLPALLRDGTWTRPASPGTAVRAIAATGGYLFAVVGSVPDTRLEVACPG